MVFVSSVRTPPSSSAARVSIEEDRVRRILVPKVLRKAGVCFPQKGWCRLNVILTNFALANVTVCSVVRVGRRFASG